VLCPAGCELTLAPAGPDKWRAEYPLQAGQGLCPRGSALGELLAHGRRILTAGRRQGDRLEAVDLARAYKEIASAPGDGLVVLLDGNVPCEHMVAAAACCRDWPNVQLCLVLEPAEEQLLLGAEASGAEYLSGATLAECDGFVLVGDVFAANPTCAKAIFDHRREDPRTPIVVIDAAAGTAAKFATHRVDVRPGGEATALAELASAAGVQDVPGGGGGGGSVPSAAAAAAAVAGCKRLAVVLAAEHGRGGGWRLLGYVAGLLAKARGGGLAVQASGANALAAVRLSARLGTASLAEALSASTWSVVVIGADVVGMLGRDDLEILAAAAPLPNATTERAGLVLPVALPGEYGGTYLLDGGREVKVGALMAPPAGVPTPAELVAGLAASAGRQVPAEQLDPTMLGRLELEAPAAAASAEQAPAEGLALALGRQAMHAGCGALTASASWQAAVQPVPELRISPRDAAAAGIVNLAQVTVRAGERTVSAVARVAPELPAGVVVLPEGCGQVRQLLPARIDVEADMVVAEPVTVEVSA